jgi:arylsulfatase A-like enzyme
VSLTRRQFVASAAVAGVHASAFAQQPLSKSNVIWLFGDQHRAQAMGCMGDPNANTPNLDAMASSGVLFPQAVSGMPLCCPFRGSMLTSRYPHKCVPGHEYPLPDGQQTIAHVFKQAGYKTAHFGKWHLGWAQGAHRTRGDVHHRSR